MTKQTEDKELTIIGGGITGLAAAYIAAKEGLKVQVLEASDKFGGLLRTFEVGNNKLEYFYHHFFTHDKEIHWLIKELGIEHKLEYYKTTMSTYRNNKLYDFNSPLDLLKFRPIKWIDKIKFGFTSLYLGKLAKWEEYEDVSALEWFQTYAGNSATESLWKPMLDIKFGPYADKVPLSWMIGRLRQRLNSRKAGDERLGYIEGSLNTLLDALIEKLTEMGVVLKTNSPVTKLNFDSTQKILLGIDTESDSYVSGDFLFTIPGTTLAKILPEYHKLRKELNQIEYFGAVCVVLEMNKALSNTYWINVADPGFDFGGIIEHTNFIPPEKYDGKHIVYLSRYFDTKDPLFSASDEQISDKLISQLKQIFPQFNISQIEKINIFRTPTAATVCDLNFSKKILHCNTEYDNMFIANMMHIYPDERSVNNSIRVALEACKTIGISKIEIPKSNSLSGKIGFKK